MADKKSETVTLTIDGQEVTVPKGTMVFHAAKQLGISIPHFCYHPNLSIAGVCRMCLVEVEKMPKLATSCSTMAGDGMVVRTGHVSDKVREAVKGVLELHFINHPIDCPICDQAGECKLQDYYWEWGLYVSRFLEQKVANPKHTEIGPMVTLDADRCILCSRCVRFCREVPGSEELCIVNRGDHAEISLGTNLRLDNPYSANVVDICPVGAHTLTDFRFKCRAWYLSKTPSVCPGCARGCSISVEHHKNRVFRIKPRANPEVNGPWMCDEGRMTYKRLYDGERLEEPLVAERAGLEPVSWDDAVDKVKEILGSAGEGAVGIGSPHATNEENYLLMTLLDAVGSKTFGVGTTWEPTGEDDEILRRADLSTNRTGAQRILGETGFTEALEGAKVAVILADDPLADAPAEAFAAIDALDEVIVLSTHVNATTKKATVALPIAAFAERGGTVTNFLGQTQIVEAAVEPPGEARSAVTVLAELLEALGAKKVKTETKAVFDEVAKKVKPFKGLTFAKLGDLGAGGTKEEKS